MDKGIRPACNAKFAELNTQRQAGTLTNTQFRKTVMAYIMEEFGITLASAATHYNHSFQAVKTATPTLVEGLGRAEDKKGGRKPKAATAAPEATAATSAPAAQISAAAALVGIEDLVKEPALVNVCKKDGTVVAEGISREKADELIAKAAAQKKGKLVIQGE